MPKLQVTEPRNRLLGDMPKIGIRPTIDGRLGGVREVARGADDGHGPAAWPRFLTANLRHPNGLPVECVIADTTHRRRGRGRPLRREVRARPAWASR